jgi:peptidyl-dipeptidase Dcp
MRTIAIVMAALALLTVSCAKKETPPPAPAAAENPFFTAWTTPFETPPFDKIKEAHYMPAFEAGMAEQKKEVEAIAADSAAPTFANTVEALEKSGALLTKVGNVFFNLTSSNTNEEMQKIEAAVTPLLAKHQDDINLNPKLFARVKSVYAEKDKLGLSPEQSRLLDKTYKNFVRNGANLDDAKKAELRKINEELSILGQKFGENLLKEDNGFALVLENKEELAGLPDSVIQAAAQAAKGRGMDDKWLFTLHKPSCVPFFQYSSRRDLREKLFKAFINRGNNGNAADNKAIASRTAALRVTRANLLGYKTHAEYVLEENMAKTPGAVFNLLGQVWTPALAMAKKEAKDLQALIDAERGGFSLEPWDWWYYSEKLRKQKYDLDDATLKPYFKLENVRDGAFEVARKLWGLQFIERSDIPKYHPDVRTFEVKEADGTHLGIYYTDYFPRPSKRGGAWSNTFRTQSARDRKMVTPVVSNNGNFSMPVGDTPSLLTFEEATTLFHEFGHALQDLMSHCTYEALAGTNVPRDYVELCSQVMENWARDTEVIKAYARHYKTGEPIPQALIDKIRNAELFNQGFETVEYMAACYLDMGWHTLTEAKEQDTLAFDAAAMKKIGLIPQIVVRYRSPYFQHIFSYGYSAGYYSYLWSQVLDADAFQAFKETSLYDAATAASFRTNIMASGDTDDAMAHYKKFRGREPKVDALLKRKGFMK